jgi:cytosine/adenosine deaminase-related metal-dependent hydrolase
VARAFPSIDRHDVLRMGTLSGAEALGLDRECGSITPGKPVNLVALPLSAPGSSVGAALDEILSGDARPMAMYFLDRTL